MGIRPGHCYRDIQRAYTRKSKYKNLSYVKAVPTCKIVRFDMGDQRKPFTHRVSLIAQLPVQIRDNAIESSRQLVVRALQGAIGLNYYFKIRIYPHHVLRENRMLTGAGADRMQRGMQLSFGMAIGIAAQVFPKQEIYSIDVFEDGVNAAQRALQKAIARIPGKFLVTTKERSNVAQAKIPAA